MECNNISSFMECKNNIFSIPLPLLDLLISNYYTYSTYIFQKISFLDWLLYFSGHIFHLYFAMFWFYVMSYGALCAGFVVLRWTPFTWLFRCACEWEVNEQYVHFWWFFSFSWTPLTCPSIVSLWWALKSQMLHWYFLSDEPCLFSMCFERKVSIFVT